MPLSSDRLDRYIPIVQLFAARLVLFHAKVAERLGLTATEFKCFRLLEQLGPLSLTTLAQEAGLQLGTASGLVDKLEAAALLTRRRDPTDRRRSLLLAAPEAAERIGAFYREQGLAMRELLDTFRSSEFEAILRFLDQAGSVLAQSQADMEATAAPVASVGDLHPRDHLISDHPFRKRG